jgi:alpha-2-macroglobulin
MKASQILLLTAVLSTSAILGAEGDAAPGARPAVSSLPRLPAPLHDALQARDFETAVQLIDKALADAKTDVDYLLYQKGLALSAQDKFDAAFETFSKLEHDFPQSSWVSRARFGRAALFSRQRNYPAAAAIYKAEAERLLSSGRKDTLTGIYLEFADRYFEGEPAQGPAAQKQPDYEQALTFYNQALQLRPGIGLRHKIESRIARCHQELNQLPQAIEAYQRFLKSYADKKTLPVERAAPALEAEAQYQLGRAQLAAGQSAEARKTWQDFLASASAKEAGGSLVAEASYRLAHTFGVPEPASVGDLELGVAALERFVKSHPQHELAPQAEFEIARSYAHHGRYEQTVATLKALIANPAYAKSTQVAAAWNLLGQSYSAQKKHTEAIAAWREFLDKYPADSNWSNVQRVIIDTEFAMADDERQAERFDAARTLWETFLNKYPLDGRAPQVLFQFGQMRYAAAARLAEPARAESGGDNAAQSKPDPEGAKALFSAAIDDWQRLVSKYPGTNEASHAAYSIGVTLEHRLNRLADALEAYKKVEGPFQGQAQQAIANLTAKQLEIVTERKFRSHEQPHIKVQTRNLENVTVKLYRVDLADYFRKMHLATGLESLDIALIDPDKTLEHKVADYEKYRRIDQQIEIPVEGPGVTAVTVSSDTLEATTMVVVSDVDIIVKSSRNELFVFAENMRDGKPAEGVSLLVSDGNKVFAELVTGKDGILQQKFDELKTVNDLRVFAIKEGHSASSLINLEGLQFAVGLSPKGYLYTDRPAYRAGQLVHLKGIVRWVADDRYTFKPGEKYQLDIYDARGRVIHTENVALGEFGTIASHWTLPESSPQGQYRVHLFQPGRDQSYETSFLVHEYQLEPISFSVDLPQKVFYRGEHVTGKFVLKYYYGTPLAGRAIQYRLGDDRWHGAETDANGEVKFDLETQRYSESQPLQLVAQYPERNLVAGETLYLSTRGFQVGVSAIRSVYIAGETFDATVAVHDPAGKPVAVPLKFEVFEQTPALRGMPAGEKLVQTHELKSDEKTGQARQTVRIEKAGRYVLRATGIDRFENPVSGAMSLIISGEEDKVRLRILADKHHFKVGDVGNVQIHWREKPALALVTYEGAEVLGYKLVELKPGSNPFELPLAEKLAPNFDLAVAVMEGDRFHEARSQFQVSRELIISLKPEQTTLKPGDALSVEVSVTDPNGRPVSAEVSLALVQKNLLEMFPDQAAAIDTFLNGGARQVSVRAMTSCVFRYAPPTRPINLFLLAEEDRKKILGMEADARVAAGRLVERQLRERVKLGAVRDEPMAEFGVAFDADHAGLPAAAIELEELNAPISGNALFAGGMGEAGGLGGMPGSGEQAGAAASDAVSVHGPGPGQNRYWSAPQRRNLARGGRPTGAAAGKPTGLGMLQRRPGDPLSRSGGEMADFSTMMDLYGSDVAPQTLNETDGERSVQRYNRMLSLFIQQTQEIEPSRVDHFFSDLSRADGTIVGINRFGEYQVVNGLTVPALQKLASEGLEIVAGMAAAETGYWNPRVVTDKEGKATVVLRVPDRSTAWKLLSRGINAETLAGQAEAELVTKKDLFGEMKTPLAFTAGDRANVLVEIHNATLQEGTIDVRFKSTLGDKTTELKKSIAVTKTGIEELSFPIDIASADSAQFELTVFSGELTDDSSRSVPVVAYGLPVYSSVSGTAAQNTSVIVNPPAGMTVEHPKLELVLGPSVNRTLLDAVLGGHIGLYERFSSFSTNASGGIERAVSDTIGAVALLKMIGASRTTDTPEAQALAGRIQSSISLLVSSQRDDGGWSWSGKVATEKPDRYMSSRAMWALAAARRAGFAVPQPVFDKGIQYLQTAFAAAAESDNEGKAVLLHGLAEAGVADFAHANRLHRNRNALSASGLVHLALVFARLDRRDFLKDLLAIARDKISVKPAEGGKPAADEALRGCIPWMQSGVELRALYLLALNEAEPAGSVNAEVADWLMSARSGSRWFPEKANGPAVAALADWYGRAKLTSEKYTLTIYANDRQVEKLTIDPSIEPSRTIAIPEKFLVAGKPQRINIDIDGRGTFSYSAIYGGFVPADKLKGTTNDWRFTRFYEPALRMLDGEAIPRGFGVLTGGYTAFKNPLTQLPLGERGEVSIHIWRNRVTGVKDEQFDYLVYTEPIPAGTTVLRESIQGSFERYEITPGAITFYIGDRPYPGSIQFTLVGYLPGQFKNVPSVLRSFYQPDRMAVAKDLPLEVLARGGKSQDEYRLSPQELYEFGKRLVARRDYAAAGEYLTPLFRDWRLQDNIYREVVQMLFETALAANAHGDIVQYFEIIKEKYPDVEVSFENILKVAQAYLELGEYERGYLVYRATTEASFQRESQIAGFLDGRGEFLRSVQVMERLLREYPAESYIAIATYALAQEVYGKAPEAAQNPKLRDAGVTRVDLIATAVHMLDHFISTWPNDPAADQAGFSLAKSLLDLEQYAAAIERCGKYAERYPDSKLLDSFWYVIGYSQFASGRHDAALEMCRKVADYKRKDPSTGVELAAANQWQAIYIMGQVFHSLGKPAEAIAEYERVKERFADASEAIEFFTHKEISLPEITTVKPGDAAKPVLKFRNVAAANVKVYRIDLLKFGLLQRNLSRITAINLAGIRPYHDLSLKLGDGKDYREREQELDLPLKDEGAYLVVCQGENLYASGLVLVSPLVLEVQEDAASGRVRVTVKNAVSEAYAHNIHVKVIGSRNEQFVSGQSDLRGIFIADGINGTSTVIAKTDANRYAFFRGKSTLGSVPQSNAAAPAAQPPADKEAGARESLLKNLDDQQQLFNGEQRMNYRNLLDNKKQGVEAKAAF